MKLINGKAFVDLENYLDMKSFNDFHSDIILSISKNADFIEPSYAPRKTLKHDMPAFFEERIKNREILPTYSSNQINWFTKLGGVATLGSHLVLQGITGYPSTYRNKHLSHKCASLQPNIDFDFLHKWIIDQKCFSDYGRVMFWINEPSQQTAFHSDHGNINSDLRDMFIWLTGVNRKQMLLQDSETSEIYTSTSSALTFNSANWHCSLGNPNFTSWSLRIDGTFDKNWAQSVGIDEYYNI